MKTYQWAILAVVAFILYIEYEKESTANKVTLLNAEGIAYQQSQPSTTSSILSTLSNLLSGSKGGASLGGPSIGATTVNNGSGDGSGFLSGLFGGNSGSTQTPVVNGDLPAGASDDSDNIGSLSLDDSGNSSPDADGISEQDDSANTGD